MGLMGAAECLSADLPMGVTEDKASSGVVCLVAGDSMMRSLAFVSESGRGCLSLVDYAVGAILAARSDVSLEDLAADGSGES